MGNIQTGLTDEEIEQITNSTRCTLASIRSMYLSLVRLNKLEYNRLSSECINV